MKTLDDVVENFEEITGYTLDQLFKNVDAMDQEIVYITVSDIEDYIGEKLTDDMWRDLDDKLKQKYLLGR